MNAQSSHRLHLAAALSAHSCPAEEAILIGEALDRCRVSDVEQVAWELAKAKVKVPATALLAMALSRSVVRQVAEQYACQEQLKQAKKLVPKTGDKQAA